MTIIINAIDIIDANGLNLTDSITKYKQGNTANSSRYAEDQVAGLIKYDVPATTDEVDAELKSLGFDELFMPRPIKLSVLSALRACQGMTLPKNTAVIGTTLEGSSDVKYNIWNAFEQKKSRISPKLCAIGTASTICTTISRTLKLTGPSLMITQACSGFLTALSIAESMLLTRAIDTAIIIGVESTTPISAYIFNSMGVYTKDKIMPFDKNRSGMALGEGVACYVVTREDSAQKYVAKIKKISLYNDFYNLTSPSPDGSAGLHLLQCLGAFENKIDSFNCHATSTKVGDDIELKSLEQLPYETSIYGLKGSLGHTLAASAGIETAYSIVGMQQGWIPYTSLTTDPLLTKHDIVLHNIKKQDTSNFIKLSFGFGGVSAGILVEK
jgi:3-oxoacyl-[acyl-carrier-protein] synthase II